MMDEEPAAPAEEVEAVEDSGSAQVEVGIWALPEAGSITSCPKCGPLVRGDDSGSMRVTIHFHNIQRAYAPDEPDEGQPPCAFLDPSIFPVRLFGAGGEHMCIVCMRCHYGWVEQVARPESIYRVGEVEG